MNYEITEEQIKELCELTGFESKINNKLKKMFPEVFEKKLEVGKWYKDINTKKGIGLIFVKEYKGWDFGLTAYGFDWCNGDFIDEKGGFCINSKQYLRLATDSEVEEALINEAKKRGLKYGVYINDIYCGSAQVIINSSKFYYEEVPLGDYKGKKALRDFSGNILFVDGIWATPIKTYTKEEAEKLLNAKII